MKTIANKGRLPAKISGFTLLELMIVVAVIGIISVIALPSYLEQVRKTKRSEAPNAAVECAAILERRYTMRREYTSTDCDVLSGTLDNYQIAVTHPGGAACESNGKKTCFLITVTPKTGSSQAKDLKCTSFTLNETGGRSAAGSDTSQCWRS